MPPIVAGPHRSPGNCRSLGTATRWEPPLPGTAARPPVYGVRLSWRAVHIEDADLIARARSGDVTAYESIVRRYQDVAMRTAYLICPETDADDAVQEAFLKAYDALPRFREGAPIRPWLLRIVANEARNRRRSAGRRHGLALRVADAAAPQRTSPGPEQIVMAEEQRAELLAALNSLRDDDREVLGARFLLDLSETETAETLRIPRGTVKSRTSRALGRLRIALGAGTAADLDLGAGGTER
jgi:RNA polymerase sigma factor (sigma-70 family)